MPTCACGQFYLGTDTACPVCREEIARRGPVLRRRAMAGLAPGPVVRPYYPAPVDPDVLPTAVPVLLPQPPAIEETKPSGGIEGETDPMPRQRKEIPGYTLEGPIERLSVESDDAYEVRRKQILNRRYLDRHAQAGAKPKAKRGGRRPRKVRPEGPAPAAVQDDAVRASLQMATMVSGLMQAFLDTAAGRAAIAGLESTETRPDAAIAIFAAGVRAGKAG